MKSRAKKSAKKVMTQKKNTDFHVGGQADFFAANHFGMMRAPQFGGVVDEGYVEEADNAEYCTEARTLNRDLRCRFATCDTPRE